MRLFALVPLVLAAAAAPSSAQEVAHVHKQDLREIGYPAGHQTLMVRTTIDPRAVMPPHTHPGIEAGYVLQGTATVKIAGQKDQAAKAGDSFIIPPRTLHSVVNTGDDALVILTDYVVDAGEPLIEFAHKP